MMRPRRPFVGQHTPVEVLVRQIVPVLVFSDL